MDVKSCFRRCLTRCGGLARCKLWAIADQLPSVGAEQYFWGTIPFRAAIPTVPPDQIFRQAGAT